MPLRRLIVLYEPEASCRARLIEAGRPAEVAAEIAFYLAQATDLIPLMAPIAEAFSSAGIEASFHAIDDHGTYLPQLLRADPAATLLWCMTDGFFLYRGSLVGALGPLLGVPTFGSGPQAQHLCQDKLKCTALARGIGVLTPETLLARDGRVLWPTSSPRACPSSSSPTSWAPRSASPPTRAAPTSRRRSGSRGASSSATATMPSSRPMSRARTCG